MRRFLLKFSIFLVCFGFACELFFRSVIPARETPLVRQDPNFGLMQFDPNGPRDGLFTSGRYAEQRSRWHINAQGYNHGTDFRPDSTRGKPAVVITGDSQIEGFYVDLQSHVIKRLETRSQGQIDGYSMAASGYKLGEYVTLGHYLAKMEINPAVLVVFINQGDFWRGVTNLAGKAGVVPRISIGAEGRGSLTKSGVFPISRWRRLLRHSATVRYLFFNARLNPFSSGPAELAMNAVKKSPESDAGSNPVYAQAFAFMVRELKQSLPRTRLLFLVDADRRAIMADREAVPIPTSGVVAEGCRQLGCVHLDLTETFTRAWRSTRKPLHFDHDVHWNAHAHDLAAAAIYQEMTRRRWLPERKDPH